MARPIGAKNKHTLERELLVEHLTNGGMQRLMVELEKLEGLQYVTAYTRILEFFMPKLKRIDASVSSIPEVNTFTVKNDGEVVHTINFMDSF